MPQASVLNSVIQPRQPSPGPKILPLPESLVEFAGERLGGSDPDEMEEALAALVENAPVAMAMFNRDMRYVLANRQWISDFGLHDALPLVGRSQFEVFPHLHPGWRSVYDRGFQGHVVRSEHDIAHAPDGRALIFRWEVRPWRRKRDAAVAGLMVTCETFSKPLADLSDPANPAAQVGNAIGESVSHRLVDCTLPMVLLNADGVIQEANSAAMQVSLARGVQEGVSYFWEAFGGDGNQSELRAQAESALAQVLGSIDSPAATVDASTCHSVAGMLLRWEFGRCPDAAGHAAVLAVACVADTPVNGEDHLHTDMPLANSGHESLWQLEKRQLQEQMSVQVQEIRLLQGVEQAFKRREQRQREVLDSMPCGLVVLDERGRPSFHNAHVRNLFGRELSAGETVEDWLVKGCVDDTHREEVSRLWLEGVWRRQLTKIMSLTTADGLLKHFEFRPTQLRQHGGVLVTIHDVTDACRLEEMLRSSEAKLRTLLGECPLPLVLTDPAGAIYDVNAAAEQLFHHPKSELRRTSIDDWLSADSVQERRFAAKEALAGEEHSKRSFTIAITTVGGEAALLRIAVVNDADGIPHSMAHFFERLAVTDKEALHAAAEIPPAPAGEQAPAAVQQKRLLRTDRRGRIVDWTCDAEDLFGYAQQEAQELMVHTLFKPSDATGFYSTLPDSGEVCWAWFGQEGRRGETVFVLQRSEQQGASIELLLPAHTTASEGEESSEAPKSIIIGPTGAKPWPLADLERERLLLTETHHRIKNHLQLLSSLLNLQSNTLDHEGAREALRTSQNRVRAIAALHQHLYQLALGEQAGLGEFIEELAKKLCECYELPQQDLSFSVQVGQHRLREEWFMPMALILNEALSNSFKHGRPAGEKGEIVIALRAEGSQAMHLTVQDNGPGLPDNFDASSSLGLGLKIIGVFADQMHGSVSLENIKDSGLLFDLRFPMGCVDN